MNTDERRSNHIMELGATVCLPGEPRCADCPVAASCRARAEGTARELPVKPGTFAHTITHHHYTVTVVAGRAGSVPAGMRWLGEEELANIPLTTASRKTLRLAGRG